MDDNQTPSTPPLAGQPAKSRLVRRSPRPMALEQRFVFDGAGGADVVEAVASQPSAEPAQPVAQIASEPLPELSVAHAAPAQLETERAEPQVEAPPLFNLSEQQPALDEAAALAAAQIRSFITEASDAQLFELFSGEQTTAGEQWTADLTHLRASIADGTLDIEVSLLDNADLQGALAAYAPQGQDGTPTIFLNRDWLPMLDAQQISGVLVEEYGHHIDHLLNRSIDTAGDEGQRFAAAVSGSPADTLGFAADDDRGTLQIDGESLDVEFATLTFNNAYEVNTATTPAGKESNSHDFQVAPLGQVFVNDATNSRFFSGNDVSATSLTIKGETIHGWISRPIKSGGIVRGFYFWTDADFNSLAAAQADGNMDGDSNVADNRGFLLVVDQAWFSSLAWKNQTDNLKNVGSSSDRVDSALNTLVVPVAAPVAVADTANGEAGTFGAAAVEAGHATTGSNAVGNVLSNDTSSSGKVVVAIGSGSASQAVTTSTTAANGTSVAGLYGSLTLGADGSYRYVVNDANPLVEALRTASDTLVDTFTYRMTDASGATSTTTLSVTVRGANDAPLASNDYNAAKESIAATGQYGVSDNSGSQAIGNVLTNDTDVDRGDTKTVADLAGSAVISTVTTTTTSAALVFVPGTTFSPVGNGDEAWLLVNGTYRALFSSTGAQITATGSYDSTARTIPLSAAPATYYDSTASGNRVAITSLDGQKIGFKDTASTTTTTDNSMKIGSVMTSQSTGTSTVTMTPSASSGVIATGMLVSGMGVPADTLVQSVTYDAAGTPVSIVLSKTITSPANSTLSFYAATGTTITGRHGTLQLNADGSYIYTPIANNQALSEGQSAVEQFQYTVRDASGVISSATLFITVLGSGSNDPNAVNDVALATEAGGTANNIAGVNPSGSNLLGNDTTPSGSNQVVSARASSTSSSTAVSSNTEIIGLYGKLTLSADGSYTYAVDNSNPTVQALRDSVATLTDSFVYTIQNGQSVSGVPLKDSATLTITIRGANDAPIATDVSATAIEAEGVKNSLVGFNPSGNVLASASDLDDAQSELRVTGVRVGGVEGGGSAGVVGSSLAGLYGSLTLNANGNWTYLVDNSNAAVQALNPGDTLLEHFNYTITDRSGISTGLSDTAVLTITINGAADTVAVNSVFVNEASPYAVFTVTGSAGVAVRLELGSASLPSTDTRATLTGMGADIATTLEHFNGSSWQVYVANSSVIIPTGDKLLVRIAVNQDEVHEGNESFTLTAFVSPDNNSTGIGTINDEGEGDIYLGGNISGTPDATDGSGYPVLDDDRPTLSVANVPVTEGSYAEFVVSIDKRSTQPISFTPVLASSLASVGTDTGTTAQLERFDGNNWVVVSGPVSIAPGELSVRLRIATIDDSFVEQTETFSLLTGSVSGTVTNLAGAEGTATILDNDTAAPNNRAPVAANDSLAATEDTPATYTPAQLLGNDSDPDNDSLSIASVTRSTGGSVVLNQDGSLTFTPDPDFNGVATFTYTVTDGNLVSNAATVSITVAAVNDPAVISGVGTGSVTEDLNVSDQGKLTTTGSLTVTDPDAGEASFQSTVTSTTGTLGSLTIAANGSWTYSVPNNAVQYLKNGETKIETFTVSTVDGTQRTVTVTINGVSDTAVIGGNATGAVTEDLNVSNQGMLTTTGSLTVTDPDAVEASFQSTVTSTTGTLGTLTIAANGSWTYSVPNNTVQYLKNGETKVETFTVSTVDGTQRTVTVTINGLNDTAQIGPLTDANADGTPDAQQGTVQEDTTLSTRGTLTVSDPDTNQAVFQPQTNVAGTYGTFSLSADGAWTYTLNNDAANVQALRTGDSVTDRFDVLTADGTSTTVVVTVLGLNDTAQIGPLTDANADGKPDAQQGTVQEDTTPRTSGTLTVSDPDTNQAVFQPQTNVTGTYGTFSLSAEGAWTYTLNNDAANVQALKTGDSVTDRFDVLTADGASTTVVVTVLGLNDTAQIGPLTDANADGKPDAQQGTVQEDRTLSTNGQLTVSDPDTNQAVFQPQTNVAGTFGTFSLTSNGAWTYTLNNDAANVQALKTGDSVTDRFDVLTADGASTTVVVTVLGLNDTAQIGPDTDPNADGTPDAQQGTVQEDRTLRTSGQLTVRDSDANQAVFRPQTNVTGTYGTFSLSTDGAWTYTLNNSAANVQALKTGDSVTDRFDVLTADGASTTVVVTVLGLNDTARIGPVTDPNADGTPDAQQGTVQEDTTLSTRGTLTVSDPDTNQAVFQPQTNVTGTYGTFSLSAEGAWTYTLNSDAANVQALRTGDSVTDRFDVLTADGASTTVVVTVLGLNDTAQIGPLTDANAGTVQEDTTLSTRGTLTISDPDTNQAVFRPQTNVTGTYGSFSLSADGAWTYTLNNDAANVQALKTGDSVTDRFDVLTADGTASSVVVTVLGLEEQISPPPAPPVPDALPPTPPVVVAVEPAPAPQPTVAFDSTLSTTTALASPAALNVVASASQRVALEPATSSAAWGDVYTSRAGFPIVVIEAAQPTLAIYRGVTDQYADAGSSTSFSVPYDAFAHTDPSEEIVLSASLANGEQLPGWLVFNPQSGKFELKAPAGEKGELTVKVVARDSKGREVSVLFRITLGERKAAGDGRTSLSDQLRVAGKRGGLAFAPPADASGNVAAAAKAS